MLPDLAVQREPAPPTAQDPFAAFLRTLSLPAMAAASSAAPRSALQKVTSAGPQPLTTAATLLPRPVLPTHVTLQSLRSDQRGESCHMPSRDVRR